MSLDSTDTFSNVMKDTFGSEFKPLNSEIGQYPKRKNASSWCYLFVHHTKVESVTERLGRAFNVFVHKSVLYKKEKGHVRTKEQPTISGLIFIQGEVRKIQHFLNENFVSLRLVNDCSTGKIAVIPDSMMQPFIQLSRLDAHRIRFMPHSFGYYAAGHPLVRITSGILAGMEGYQIRIAKDRCLVTSMGGMTVAIGQVHKETFENVDEYVRQRREEQSDKEQSREVELTSVQSEINRCFFQPQNQLDVVAIAGSLYSWAVKASLFVKSTKLQEAAEIALFILEEVGNRFQTIYDSPQIGSFKELTEVCTDAVNVLAQIEAHPHAGAELAEYVETERHSLAIRYPFLPIEL